MKPFSFLFIAFFITINAKTQNVGINTTGAVPHASAMLDIENANKGILIPRVSLSGINDNVTINAPSVSLLIYNTNTVAGTTGVTPGFYYWSGSSWTSIITKNRVWERTGNAGTTDGVDFIGTTDPSPLNFRVNNVQAGRILHSNYSTYFGYRAGINVTTQRNTAIGYGSLEDATSFDNTAVGYDALNNTTTGYNNTAIGSSTLGFNTTGGFNASLGAYSLFNNTTGYRNHAVGSYSLYSNSIGYENVAVGYYSLYGNTSGYQNVAVGGSTLGAITTGNRNTAIGHNALRLSEASANTAIGSLSMTDNTTGGQNTALGSQSMPANTTGGGNVAIGVQSHYTNTTGGSNTIIGAFARTSTGDISGSTALGYGAVVNANNKVRIGSTTVTVIEGQVAFSNPSDARFKYNVKSNVPGLAFITRLKPVTYYFDTEKLAEYNSTGKISAFRNASNADQQIHTGFLAQDVEKIIKEMGFSFDGLHVPENDKDHYSLSYSQFVMPLVKAVQEQQEIIENQQKEIDKLKADFEKLAAAVKALTK